MRREVLRAGQVRRRRRAEARVVSEFELRNEVRLGEHAGRLPEIYAFVNGGEPGWWNVQALTEDGEFIAGHCCSHPSFGPHDMGVALGSDWKHDHYRERYPRGFVVIWIDGSPKYDPRVAAAYEKHLAHGPDGSPWQRSRAVAS
jgi:hypothetical protein